MNEIITKLIVEGGFAVAIILAMFLVIKEVKKQGNGIRKKSENGKEIDLFTIYKQLNNLEENHFHDVTNAIQRLENKIDNMNEHLIEIKTKLK